MACRSPLQLLLSHCNLQHREAALLSLLPASHRIKLYQTMLIEATPHNAVAISKSASCAGCMHPVGRSCLSSTNPAPSPHSPQSSRCPVPPAGRLALLLLVSLPPRLRSSNLEGGSRRGGGGPRPKAFFAFGRRSPFSPCAARCSMLGKR